MCNEGVFRMYEGDFNTPEYDPGYGEGDPRHTECGCGSNESDPRHTECAILDPVSMNEGEWHTEHDPGSSGGDPRHSAYYPESTE